MASRASGSLPFDRVLVINLSRNPERWFDTLHRLDRAGVPRAMITRVCAVDCNSPEHQAFYADTYPTVRAPPDARYPRLTRLMSLGEVAVVRSFLRAMELWRRHPGWRRVLLLEDKVLPQPELASRLSALLEANADRLGDAWAVQIGASQHVWSVPEVSAPDRGLYPAGSTDGAFATLMFDAFREPFAAQLGLFQGPSDAGGIRLLAKLNPERVWVAFPNLVACDVSRSELGHTRDLTEHAKKMRWDLGAYITERCEDAAHRASVVMTYFDSPETVAMAVDSYRAQKYHNLEVIVVDDASERPPVLSAAARADPRVRVIRLPENRGTYYAKCHGLRRATGWYLFFADSDDYARPFRVSQQLGALFWARPLPVLAAGAWIRDSRPFFPDTTGLTAYFEERKDRLGRETYHACEVPALITQAFTRETLARLLAVSEPHCRPFDTLTRHSADAEIAERLLAIEFGKVMNVYDHLNVLLRRGGRPDLGVWYDSSTALLYAAAPSTSLTSTLRVNTAERLEYRRGYLRRHWDLYGYVPLFGSADRAGLPRTRRVRNVAEDLVAYYWCADPPVFGLNVPATVSNERLWRVATALRERNSEIEDSSCLTLGVILDGEQWVTDAVRLQTAMRAGTPMLATHLVVPTPWRRSLQARVPPMVREIWTRLFPEVTLARELWTDAPVDHRCEGYLEETAGAAVSLPGGWLPATQSRKSGDGVMPWRTLRRWRRPGCAWA